MLSLIERILYHGDRIESSTPTLTYLACCCVQLQSFFCGPDNLLSWYVGMLVDLSYAVRYQVQLANRSLSADAVWVSNLIHSHLHKQVNVQLPKG